MSIIGIALLIGKAWLAVIGIIIGLWMLSGLCGAVTRALRRKPREVIDYSWYPHLSDGEQ